MSIPGSSEKDLQLSTSSQLMMMMSYFHLSSSKETSSESFTERVSPADSGAERERSKENDLEMKVESFLDQLNSKSEPDVEVNAQILADLIRSFSLTFGVDTEEIALLISQSKTDNGINLEEVRRKLLSSRN